MADLIAKQSVRTMRGSESGTSVVQVRVPEFKVVNFRVVKKGRCVIGIMGGDNKQDELREMLEENLRGPYPGEEYCYPARDWQ